MNYEIFNINKNKTTKINDILIIFTSILYVISIILWVMYDPYQLDYQHSIVLKIINYHFYFGIDGLSLFFIYLTTFLIPLCLIFGHNNKIKDNKFTISLVAIELLLIIVFTTLDFLMFYIFFEAILIPFFIFIGIRGYRTRRIHASYLLFFYTIAGSLLMLVSIVLLYTHTGTTYLETLYSVNTSYARSNLIWFLLFLSFSVKIPVFPFHIWLPEAHVEAPTEGSVLLAGVLLKLGIYGLLRFSIPLFPEASVYFSPIVLMLSTLALIYTSLTTLRQIDVKRIIAYSSVAHMNLCVIGIFTFDPIAVTGTLLLMLGHGIVSGGLFFAIGMMYERYHTKIIKYYSGLVQTMPLLAVFMFLLVLGNISMPGTSNFISEFLILCGIYNKNYIYILLFGLFSIFIGTVYSLLLYNRTMFGLPNIVYMQYTTDLTYKECVILIPLIIHMLWLGIYPASYIDVLYPTVIYNNFNII